jgi:hypothetical protein
LGVGEAEDGAGAAVVLLVFGWGSSVELGGEDSQSAG